MSYFLSSMNFKSDKINSYNRALQTYKKSLNLNIIRANILGSSSSLINGVLCLELYTNTIDFLYSRIKPISLYLLDTTHIDYLNSWI